MCKRECYEIVNDDNKWLDYWYYEIGTNPIPVVSRYKSGKKGFEWKEWQLRSLPEDLFVKWKNEGAYSDGVGITVGTVWRGDHVGKNLIFIDCDNSMALDEIISSFGDQTTLKDFAARFIVEQHLDNPHKAHVYFYSEIQFPKKSSDILEKEMARQKEGVGVPLFEIKGRGSHGIAYCTPSLHQDGHRYEIIGTLTPIVLDQFTSEGMLERLDEICKKHGLHYRNTGEEDANGSSNKIPMESLFEEDFQIYKGSNRHEALLRIMESLILRNRRILKPEIIKEIAENWNRKQCVPPLDSNEVDRQWKDANAYVVRLLRQQGREPTEKELEESRRIQQTIEKTNDLLIEQFRKPNHNIPTYRISQLGVNQLKEYVVVTGTVVGLSELVPSWKMVKWVCKICGNNNNSDKFDKTKPPKTCAFCSESQGFVSLIDTEMMEQKLNQQTILLQDRERSLSCVLEGVDSEMNKVRPGQKVQAFGLQRYKTHYNKKSGQNEWMKYFELLDIKPIAGLDVTYTDRDVEYFNELVTSSHNFIDEVLIPSFAPHIKGEMDYPKLVCIYTLASQGLERPFNSIIVGPPARGKTELVKYSASLSHNGNLATFTNVSIAGLTAETVRDPISGTMLAKPGILSTYDFAAFTDLNGATQHADGKKLLLGLNDALERKVSTSGKAGGAHEFIARCAVLMDSNNAAGTWYYDEPIQKNLEFVPKSFLSRIDLISQIPEKASDQDYGDVSDANYISYAENQNPLQLHEGDWVDYKTGAPRLGFETLRKFFYYITQHQPLPPLPKEDEDLKKYFRENYIQIRKDTHEYLLDGRYNRTVLILARVRARLLLKEMADKLDLAHAIDFVNTCKNIQTLIPKTGERDGNYFIGVDSKQDLEIKDLNKRDQWVTACLQAMEQSEDDEEHHSFTKQELADILMHMEKSKWQDRDVIFTAVEEFARHGYMMEPKQGRFVWLTDNKKNDGEAHSSSI